MEGAWVITELDWGDGMACWITTLVSWLVIRVLPSWWAPGPTMAPPTVLCIEIFCPEKIERIGQKKSTLYFTRKLSKAKTGNLVMSTKSRLMACVRPWVHLSCYSLRSWIITIYIHPKSKAHKKNTWKFTNHSAAILKWKFHQGYVSYIFPDLMWCMLHLRMSSAVSVI